jgi:antitoxin HigA-1
LQNAGSSSEITRILGVSRQALHAFLAERPALTPDMALRLGKLGGNSPELWLALQTRYDLERLRRVMADEIDAIPTLRRPDRTRPPNPTGRTNQV